ncbi:MAG TPA: hypothetical protein PLP39_08900 [Flavobacterium lutivivi]|nr:hypothetical protein [Flavobacterium lutivivi]
MGLKQGMTNNKNGRPIGAGGKIATDLRSKINQIIENNIETIQKDIDSLESKDRLLIFEKLLKYALPTLQAQSIEIDLNSLSDSQLEQIINSINLNENE